MTYAIILGILILGYATYVLLTTKREPKKAGVWFILRDGCQSKRFEIDELAEMNNWWKEHQTCEWNIFVGGTSMFDDWKPADNFFLFITSNVFRDICSSSANR